MGLVLADTSYWSGDEFDNLVDHRLGGCVMRRLVPTLVNSL